MDNVGFTVNPNKSSLIPSKQLVFVGFILCSETMTVRLTNDKRTQIIIMCPDIKNQKIITIRKFAKLVGMLVACEPGVQYAPLFYKPLEKIKLKKLN